MCRAAEKSHSHSKYPRCLRSVARNSTFALWTLTLCPCHCVIIPVTATWRKRVPLLYPGLMRVVTACRLITFLMRVYMCTETSYCYFHGKLLKNACIHVFWWSFFFFFFGWGDRWFLIVSLNTAIACSTLVCCGSINYCQKVIASQEWGCA